ncbi:MAG TPA: 4-hydroxythreonine-4-phosphate dehydrogenase PdxA [Pseudobdellovibrionaceae bacterium]|nr:4-hydroxythreonine-4-phosphate dehydrogenase PdxA [Pseudobdellovibrionaceae bacterium]
MKNNLKIKYIGITTGDIDGIGLEVTAKSLPKFKKTPVLFFLWRKRGSQSNYLKTIKKSFNVKTFMNYTLAEAFVKSLSIQELYDIQKKNSRPYLIDIASDQPEPFWVLEVGKLCHTKKLNGMVTGPLSKTKIKQCGLKFLGHNEILKSISKTKDTFMGFVGNHFAVILATGHIPLSQVSKKLSTTQLKKCLLLASQLRLQMKIKTSIQILGLNPHAGEQGLLGKEEQSFFGDIEKFAQSNHIPIEGPLVPDAAFLEKNWKKDFKIFIALYHDQGLIPFKMVHGQNSGYQISLGLPFIRTSVDHGTAKDIFNKNIANPGSMKDSIQACLWF